MLGMSQRVLDGGLCPLRGPWGHPLGDGVGGGSTPLRGAPPDTGPSACLEALLGDKSQTLRISSEPVWRTHMSARGGVARGEAHRSAGSGAVGQLASST